MAEFPVGLRSFIDLVEGPQVWNVTRTPIFDQSVKDNLRIFPDLGEKLAKFLDVKGENPLRNRYGKHDGPMTGPLAGFLHCHLRDDAILIYTLKNRCINLILVCSHAEIEGKRLKLSAKRLSTYLESYHGGFKGIKGQEVVIYRNPLSKEWRECMQHEEVRAFVVGNDLLIWNPFVAVHQMVRDELNLPPTAISVTISGALRKEAYITLTDNNQRGPWMHHPEAGDEVKYCDFIRKNFSAVEISYFDEAIVGPWDEIGMEDEDEDEDELDESAGEIQKVWVDAKSETVKRFTRTEHRDCVAELDPSLSDVTPENAIVRAYQQGWVRGYVEDGALYMSAISVSDLKKGVDAMISSGIRFEAANLEVDNERLETTQTFSLDSWNDCDFFIRHGRAPRRRF